MEKPYCLRRTRELSRDGYTESLTTSIRLRTPTIACVLGPDASSESILGRHVDRVGLYCPEAEIRMLVQDDSIRASEKTFPD